VVVGNSQGVEKHVNVQDVVFQLQQKTALLLLSYLEHTQTDTHSLWSTEHLSLSEIKNRLLI
jgi:hypothetical protein